MTNGNTAPFEITGASGPGDPFGLWAVNQAAPSPVAGMVSFAALEVDTLPEEVAVWRVNLPVDIAQANDIFEQSLYQLKQTQTTLDDVPDKLDTLLASLHSTQDKLDGTFQFSAVGPEVEPNSPEADLLALVYEADMAGNISGTSGTVSFGFTDSLSGKLAEAKDEFDALLEQVNRELLNFAWVETTIAGQLIARSTVTWGGDANTFWVGGINSQQMALHQRSLKTAIETRSMRLRMVALVTSGAIRVSALLTTPGGQLMALPIAYKYIRAILAQVKN
jgi:hypothetical protein